MTDTDDKTGRFRGLQPGNHEGAKRVSAERLITMAAPALIEQLIERALSGDNAASAIVLGLRSKGGIK